MRRSTEVCLAAGVAVAVVAVSPPLDTVADGSLPVHMVQHLALTMVAAPLIALGAPVATALRLAPPAWRRPAVRALNGRVLRLAGGAAVAWLAYAAAIWVFHFSRLFNEAAANEWLHAAEHLTFLVTAVLFSAPRGRPRPAGAAASPAADPVPDGGDAGDGRGRRVADVVAGGRVPGVRHQARCRCSAA